MIFNIFLKNSSIEPIIVMLGMRNCYPQGYFIDENKVDEFDKKFPKKKKRKTRKSNILICIKAL